MVALDEGRVIVRDISKKGEVISVALIYFWFSGHTPQQILDAQNTMKQINMGIKGTRTD